MAKKIPSKKFPNKKTAAKKKPPQTIDTVVTYLEMGAQPMRREHPPMNIQIALAHLDKPPLHFYRYLYGEVGRDYNWIDRTLLNDKQLAEAIHAETTSIYVAYAGGCPAGYFEIDMSNEPEAWLAYFGIIPDFQGRGLGKWLLSEAISTAWEYKPKTVHVETCTLDDPRALSLYQRFGFRPYKRQNKTMELLSD